MSAGASVDLIWVDVTERRLQEHQHYRRQAKEFSRLSQVLIRHEEQDAGAFRRWVSGTFYQRFDELNLLDAEVQRIQELLGALRRFQDAKGETRHGTYLLVSEAQANGTLEEFMEFHCPLKPLFGGEEGSSEGEGFADFFQGMDEDAYHPEDLKKEFWQETSSSSSSAEQPGHKPKDGDPHLKDLYRQLVRALHPDLGHELNDEQLARWSAVQDAYRYGDVERMRNLYEQIVKKRHGHPSGDLDFESMSLGELVSLRRTLQHKVRGVRRKLLRARDEPHWDFQRIQSKSSIATQALRKQLEEEFRREMLRKQDVLRSLKQRLRRWSTPAKNRR